MPNRTFYVYIVASAPRRHVRWLRERHRAPGAEHTHGQVDGYTREHGCDQLVWYERHAYADQAIAREKRVKRWLRD